MKFTASFLACLLAQHALARPWPTEEGDPLSVSSRITAFVVDEKGNPSIECWEISALGSESQEVARADGSKARAHTLSLASSNSLEGLDILTWPSLSPIWPPADDTMRSQWFDLANHFSLFSIQGGLINFNVNFRFGSKDSKTQDDDDDDYSTHIFSLENGDDWFYFEDNYTGSDGVWTDASAPPFSISTISATETELLRLNYKSRPKHKVVHKGACSFTGIQTPSDGSSAYERKPSRQHSDLTVQVVLGDGDL